MLPLFQIAGPDLHDLMHLLLLTSIVLLAIASPCHCAPYITSPNIATNYSPEHTGKYHLAYSIEAVPNSVDRQAANEAFARLAKNISTEKELVPTTSRPTTTSNQPFVQSQVIPDNDSNAMGGLAEIFNKLFDKNDIITSLFNLVSKFGAKEIRVQQDQEQQRQYGQKTVGIMNRPSKQKQDLQPLLVTPNQRKTALDDETEVSLDNFNLDQKPISTSKQDISLPALNNEWKNTLFGPKGLLTEVFRFVNEKRKQGIDKAPQSDLPANSNSVLNFEKFINAFLSKEPGNKAFDDQRVPEIPFIGICNRLSCGDIYKALDQFKKSDMFSNFQTALSLIQDPKGMDVIGELLENPDLIEQFIGNPTNIDELLEKNGATSSNGARKVSSSSMSILPSDGDLGIDFSTDVDGPNGFAKNHKPEVSASVDNGNDYYTEVKNNRNVDYDFDGSETIEIEEKVPPTSSITKKTKSEPLPELSFSVDSEPEVLSSIDSVATYESKTEVDESQHTIGNNTFSSGVVKPIVQETSSLKLSTTARPTTSTQKVSPTTRNNFRKNNDYYSMYYDS